MRFTKMHGIGNDYVYVDCFAQKAPADLAAMARKIADRHFGVGGDGLILICPSEKADARMRMFNADGSEAEMCGNGIRCVAKYVYDHGIAKKPTLKIETGRGVLTLNLEIAAGKVSKVRVDMGEPILEAGKIPVELNGVEANQSVINYPLESILEDGTKDTFWDWIRNCGLDNKFTCISMGNPHAVIYSEKILDRSELILGGGSLEKHSVFSNRINVHFVQVDSAKEVKMQTWERGSGITLACGTGASAVCVAGVLTGRTGRKVLAHLPGGDLELEWNETDNHVYMTGPATEVFSGDWPD
ncbi:MAG TPA: diaminopimelate epimerase [Pirellulales bacterium]|jgi:diaminopimelate epimerase